MKYLVQKFDYAKWQQYFIFAAFIDSFNVSEIDDILNNVCSAQEFIIDDDNPYAIGSFVVIVSELGITPVLIKDYVQENELQKYDTISKLSNAAILCDITDRFSTYLCEHNKNSEFIREIQSLTKELSEIKGSSYVLSLLQDELRGRIP